MSELRIPEVLSCERLGHRLGGIAGVYSHVTPAMRADLDHALTGCWERSLAARAALHPRSPVAVLDALLTGATASPSTTGRANDDPAGSQTAPKNGANEEPPGTGQQDRLPNGSQNALQARVIRPSKGPVTWVGVAGFEPAASSSRTKRAAKLRHTPVPADSRAAEP
jgi:hypothetical protein